MSSISKQLLKLARELDEAGEHEEAEKLLEMAENEDEEGESEEADELRELAEHEEEEAEEGGECCTNKDTLQGIFDSLSDIADKLDEIGAVKEANLTDELIKKLAAKTDETPLTYENATLDTLEQARIQFGTALDRIKAMEQYGVLDSDDEDAVSAKSGLRGIMRKLLRFERFKNDALFGKSAKKLAAKTAPDKYDAKQNNEQTFIPNKKRVKPEDKHHIPEYQATGDKALSTRNCPDHFGVMLSRISDGVSECPLDGKRYNWGEAGSVAGQTPSSSSVPIPSRIFDPREDVINKIN
jgi:hypothetical protein